MGAFRFGVFSCERKEKRLLRCSALDNGRYSLLSSVRVFQ